MKDWLYSGSDAVGKWGQFYDGLSFFFFFLINFGCPGSSLLQLGFLYLQRAGATVPRIGFSLQRLLLV